MNIVQCITLNSIVAKFKILRLSCFMNKIYVFFLEIQNFSNIVCALETLRFLLTFTPLEFLLKQ